jgi:hypothetical protein
VSVKVGSGDVTKPVEVKSVKAPSAPKSTPKSTPKSAESPVVDLVSDAREALPVTVTR